MSETRVFICPKCGEPSKGSVEGQIQAYNPESGPPVEFSFLQCSHGDCQEPIVQIREDFGLGFDADKPTIYYPSPRRLSSNIPEALVSEFNEARTCFEAKAFRATLVMVRRTLEGTCAEQGATKRTLASSLGELRERGVIDGFLGEWADMLRVAGNEGAHFSQLPASKEDAQDALDFAEALLDHIYVMRARFEVFKSRRGQHSKSKES